jgi:hypothetical protein
MADLYVYSTLSSSVVYEVDGGKQILIAGGANVPDKHFLTPQGVVTKVTDSELAQLKKNRIFELHHKNGFLRWEEKKVEVEQVVTQMQGADDSAPDTEADAEVVERKTGTRTRAKKEG